MSGDPERRLVTREIGPDEAGKTLAAVVRAALGVPWSRAENLVNTRRVMIDGLPVAEVARRMREGELVSVAPEAPRVTRGMLEPERVVHLDKDVIVVRKPAGMLTVPFEDEDRDTLIDRTRVYLRHRGGVRGGEVELGAVQRLDKDTTGLVVFARSFGAKKVLSRAFADHTIERRYLALTHGRPPDGPRDTWIVKNRGDGIRGSLPVGPGGPQADAQRAVTHLRVIEELGPASLVECRLETGRTHQIRIHLAEVGCPIIGEEVYIRDFRAARIAAPRPMLHAWVLGFARPFGAGPSDILRFEEPPPDDFRDLLERLRAEAR